jgi:hypothetical protein
MKPDCALSSESASDVSETRGGGVSSSESTQEPSGSPFTVGAACCASCCTDPVCGCESRTTVYLPAVAATGATLPTRPLRCVALSSLSMRTRVPAARCAPLVLSGLGANVVKHLRRTLTEGCSCGGDRGCS